METMENSLWNSFLNNIHSLPQHSPVPTLIFSYLKDNFPKPELFVTLSEQALVFNNKALDLSHRKKIYKIFNTFLQEKGAKQVNRRTLIRSVYCEATKNPSDQHLSCLNHNVVKLISRARKLAHAAFREETGKLNFHWFPYDPRSKTWKLYEFNNT